MAAIIQNNTSARTIVGIPLDPDHIRGGVVVLSRVAVLCKTVRSEHGRWHHIVGHSCVLFVRHLANQACVVSEFIK